MRVIARSLLVFCLLSIAFGESGCRRRRRRPPPPTPPPPAVTVHQFQINRFATAGLTDAEADNILRDGTTLTQTNDGAGDVACLVELRRNGPVGVFNVGTGDINSNPDFQQVLAVPGQVEVVNRINWCGAFAPNIIGCAPIPGNSLVVVRWVQNEEGVLWTHEFGHNRGLQHRNDPDTVMNPVIGVTHRRLNQGECNAYR